MFGDGSSTAAQPSSAATHSYTGAAGTFTVTMTVTDQDGASAQATRQVSVTSGNLVGNPGFETNLNGWNTSDSGAGVTLARVSGGHSGGLAAQLATTTAKSTCELNDNPNWVAMTSAGTYTASLWVKAATAGATLNLRLTESSGPKQLGTNTASVTLSTAWQQINVTYQLKSPGSALDFNAYVSNAAVGTCFFADDASITLG